MDKKTFAEKIKGSYTFKGESKLMGSLSLEMITKQTVR
jgi:hypothetical protein